MPCPTPAAAAAFAAEVETYFRADLQEDRETELVVYRVAQEAMTNVARHACARKVEFGLSRRGDMLVLRVADDGIGGIANAVAGAGIQGMRERAHMVGGNLQMRPRHGGGTEVLLEVPVPGQPT